MKINAIRIISLTLLILTFMQIFSFSNQNGEESSGVSHRVVETIINIIPSTKNKSEEEKEAIIEKTEPVVRKLAHFTIYVLVGIFIMTFTSTFDIKLKFKFGTSIFVGLFYAISDEIHQGFVPGRSPSVFDVGIDTLGVIFGMIIVFYILHLLTIYGKIDTSIIKN